MFAELKSWVACHWLIYEFLKACVVWFHLVKHQAQIFQVSDEYLRGNQTQKYAFNNKIYIFISQILVLFCMIYDFMFLCYGFSCKNFTKNLYKTVKSFNSIFSWNRIFFKKPLKVWLEIFVKRQIIIGNWVIPFMDHFTS